MTAIRLLLFKQRVASLWSPANLGASLALWLDASDTSTITESGGAVSQWDDKSGNGNDVSEGIAANQPTTGANTQNGLNVIDFVGSAATAETLRTADGFANVDDLTVISVLKRTADFAVWMWPQDPTISVFPYFRFGLYGNCQLRINGAATSATTFDGNFQIIRADSVTGDVYADGVRTINATGATLTWPNSVPFILGGIPTKTEGFDGAIAEVIVVDGTLTADEITATEAYLADKWGITLP